VVVNVREDGQRDYAQRLLADLARVGRDEQIFNDVMGRRGTRVPITAVAADLSDERDPVDPQGGGARQAAVQRAFAP
jgi:hypothetical protein